MVSCLPLVQPVYAHQTGQIENLCVEIQAGSLVDGQAGV